MKWNKSVFSSMVNMIGYDDETQELIVTWKNGSQTAYQGVDEATAYDLSNAPSVGQVLNTDIKANYEHRKIR